MSKFVKEIRNNIISAIAYGSVVSGKIKLTSDIDILLVVKERNKILEEKIDKFKREFLENDLLLRVDLINLKELERLYKTGEPFIKSIIKQHKLLYGKSLLDLFK